MPWKKIVCVDLKIYSVLFLGMYSVCPNERENENHQKVSLNVSGPFPCSWIHVEYHVECCLELHLGINHIDHIDSK